MAIPKEKLETWSKQGAVSTAKSTADSIRNALSNCGPWPSDIKYDLYLQGSYRNSTNIRGDSDVDVVIQLNSTNSTNSIFYSNLSEDQKRILGITPASYNWEDFRSDVLTKLRKYYGSDQVDEGNKSLKVKASSGRLPADVVVCTQYRGYNSVSDYDYAEGMTFWTMSDARQIINFPKLHYENGVQKNQGTYELYKPIVRMLKNMRTSLVDSGSIESDLAPSYLLECMLYNVPGNKFSGNFQEAFCDIVNWLNEVSFDSFICQNKRLSLFGSTPEQWSQEKASLLVSSLIDYWNNWTN